MCDTSDYEIDAILGQRTEKKLNVIYYVSQTLDATQQNYTTPEKELLAIVFALEKFHAYLNGVNIIVFSDHAAICYLMTKNDTKSRMMHWLLLLLEFDFKIKDNKGIENTMANHLIRIVRDKDDGRINEYFPNEYLFAVQGKVP